MSRDADELRAAFADGSLLAPDPALPNLVALSRAVLSLVGDPTEHDDPAADDLARRIGPSDHIVLFVADGFGRCFVDGLPASSTCRKHFAGSVRAAFPSSTGPNLTSLQTGLWPAEHGFIGWRVHLTELGEPAVPYPWVRVSDGSSLDDLGVDPDRVFYAPSGFDRSTRDVRVYLPEHLLPSHASHRLARRACLAGHTSLEDGVESVIARVLGATVPTFTYLYFSGVDGTAHVHGTDAAETLVEVARVEAALTRLAEALTGTARIVLTADHGHVNKTPDLCIRVDPEDPLALELSAPPSGETHFLWLHVREGRTDAFARSFRERYGEHFFLLTADDVGELELLGPGRIPDRARERMGDFLVLSRGLAAMDIVTADRAAMLNLAATHGGLTPDEVEAPLILV